MPASREQTTDLQQTGLSPVRESAVFLVQKCSAVRKSNIGQIRIKWVKQVKDESKQ